ncbi:nuclear transport factor 2 family protein [Roseococcus thiosulfatophilus]|uniref:nuclear transport factor 2 family protein n=1 Tax=Roseococcus thiosulfatophilus TaxID=35813 RepID=UPI001A8DE634|nr:nuclear transport factor 2 family protein [Roseococcus thiosulfatophilus]
MPEGSMTLPALAAIEAVVRTYLDGLHEGDAEKIAAAFHPCAHLYSAPKGEVVDFPRADWLTAIKGRPSPQSQGLAREDRILAIDMAGDDAACVKVNCCIPPRYFTDFLLLLKTSEGWRIVAKSFHTELRSV